IFLVVLTLLGKFAWGPVLSAIQRREQFIRESLEQAKRDRAEAEKRLAEYEAQLQRARDEAAALVEAGHRDAEAARSRIQAVAATEASALLERAKTEIGLAKDNAVKELYGVVADMATDVAGKVLRRSLSEEEHGRLIKASLAEMHEHVDEHGSN
ncbi:MAG: F0F1 ATP synthase subunit B, partial [Phycisphaerae bacterium]|nr:F0F1 ATP synthase subunit B [Phycisphaerae bacterium]